MYKGTPYKEKTTLSHKVYPLAAKPVAWVVSATSVVAALSACKRPDQLYVLFMESFAPGLAP
jgi:hypothetical protein